MIQLEAIHKSFGDTHVLRGITLSIDRGEVVCIIGPSGSGKSTLLRCINYLEQPEAGRITIDGQNAYRELVNGKIKNYPVRRIAATREKIGMVFQQFNLFPHLTALQNIMEAPRQVKHMRKSEAEQKARSLLAQVGLAEKADHYPEELSGGQQQRVAIARPRHGSGSDALRRGDKRVGSGIGGRSVGDHARTGPARYDDGGRNA